MPGANVLVVHTPTGTKYATTSDFDGSYSIPACKPGGPYTIKVTFMSYKAAEVNEIYANLGANSTVNVVLVSELSTLAEVVIKAKPGGSAFSKNRTGASQQFSNREINAVPIVGSRSITSITKYNANAGANGTFGGQDSRSNNFTIDGSVFNNGFGLGGDSQAGGRTGSTAISLDAIEQLQVVIAPFDVRQSGFTGSGINAVTRSGTNSYEGSVYGAIRNSKPGFIGTKAGRTEIVPSTFDEKTYGVRFGMPIIKDKLFFFGNFEQINSTSPATTWTTSDSPNRGAQVSAPSTAEMALVSSLLQNKFGYTTGPWEGFDAKKDSKKFLAKIDWNVNDNNKLSLRYVHHDSNSDEVISNSNSVGFGNRTRNQNSMAYKNGGYILKDNTRSIVLELDTKLSTTLSNSFIAGYDYQNEDRALQGGGLFPTIDIKNGSTNYISAGLDPFTQGNRLDYNTLHFTDNITKKVGVHTYVFGANFERFVSNNLFFPASNGAYIFDSLADFTSVANGVSSPTSISTGALPSRFQYRYSALPGNAEPLQILKSNKFDLYLQDEYKVDDQLKLTYGIRATRISFENTALENPAVTALTFRNGEKFNTGEMPSTQYLFEPRFGFNLDVAGKGTTLVRGGSGIFTGRPPMVFLSNSIGNNGVLTGFVDVSGDDLRNGGYGLTGNTSQFTPLVPTLPSTFDLAFTAKNYKFPQSWKTNIAVDQKLPLGFVGTLEGIFSKNINEVFYYNANQANPSGYINGSTVNTTLVHGVEHINSDNRPFYGGTDNSARINNNVSNGVVLSNTNKGYFYSTTVKLEYPYQKGLWGSIAYTRSDAYDLMSAGSIAAGSFTGARSVNGNNNLPLSLSNNNTPHRIVGLIGYKFEYGQKAGFATSINLGYIGEQSGAFSYAYSGDVNGDRINGNDLIYVPKKASDLRFVDITQSVGGTSSIPSTPGLNVVLFNAAQQAEALDKFIDQDPYLSTRRGQYVERNSNVLPMLHKIDLSVTQDFYIKIAGKKNSFQFRADILNFTNLLNRNWGVSQRPTATNILGVSSAPSSTNGFVPGYQMATQIDEEGVLSLAQKTFQKNASIFDVWQAQFTLRYIFGK